MRENQEVLKIDLEKQVTIMRSMYVAENSTYLETKDNLVLLQNRIQNLTDFLDKDTQDKLSIEYGLELELILINVVINKENISKKQNVLAEILTNPTHASIFNLITAEVLVTELKRIKNNLVKEYELPFQNIDGQLVKTYRMAKLKVIKNSQVITFVIDFPLIRKTKFRLYRVTPIPQMNDDKFFFSTTKHGILAVSNSTYIGFEESDLSKCELIDNIYFCTQVKTEKKIDTDKSCELGYFSESNEITKCERTNVQINDELWIQLLQTNSWIYMINGITTNKLFCNGEYIKDFRLNNTGILRLANGCLIETNNTILQSTMDLEKNNVVNFTFSINVPNISIHARENNFPIKFLTKTISFSEHSVPTGLNEKLKGLEKIKLIDLQTHTHSKPWEIFTSLHSIYKIAVLLIIIIFTSYLIRILWTFYKCLTMTVVNTVKCINCLSCINIKKSKKQGTIKNKEGENLHIVRRNIQVDSGIKEYLHNNKFFKKTVRKNKIGKKEENTKDNIELNEINDKNVQIDRRYFV
jgi:hypothetical protein